jgi:hypothetical protein
LREEAVEKFFGDENQRELIDKFFEAFLHARVRFDTFDGLALAAFAAPKVGGPVGPHRQRVISAAAEDPDGGAARLLASSIGRVFRETPAPAAAEQEFDRHGSWRPARAVLIEGLGSQLASVEHTTFGTAFAALCDSIPSASAVPIDLRDAVAVALASLTAALPVGGSVDVVSPSPATEARRRTAVQNIDHACWAIASNFQRLPREFRDQLALLAESGSDDWLRLRAIEAAADYIGTIRPPADADAVAAADQTIDAMRLEQAIIDGASRNQPDILRRGIAGAIEANVDDLILGHTDGNGGHKTLLHWLESNEERYNFGFLEWAIWAVGQHLADYVKKGADPDDKARLLTAIEKLARHEDARVRKWIAVALGDGPATRDSDTLRAVMIRLAHDGDDGVRGVAADFFITAAG